MSSLVLNNYLPLDNRMKQESGDKTYPIWLLVNPKYPTAIYDIWNPILYEMQDKVYRKLHARIDTNNIFMKNAVSDIGIVRRSSNWWTAEVAKEEVILRESVCEYKPKILITFGISTYEFVRRVCEMKPVEGPRYWSTTNLGEELERSIANFDINQTNRIPLPSRVMTSDKFLEDRNDFSWSDNESYLRDIGSKIANRIIENKDSLKIWIE